LRRKIFVAVSPRFESEFPFELSVQPSQIRASAAETALMIPGAASLADHYPELSIPVAIIAGRGDRIVNSDRQSGRLSRLAAGGRRIRTIGPAKAAIAALAA
jgi:hypothetical protein